MKYGKFYGIGVGPGAPELLTLRGKEILETCPHVFVPKARIKSESVALAIAGKFVGEKSQVHEVVFPMVSDKEELQSHWDDCARQIADVISAGQDACFLTLGDALLYSTYIYLVRSLKNILPDVEVATVPGINSFSAVAALTGFPLGEGKKPLMVVPAGDDLETVRNALDNDWTVVIMKVGARLQDILSLLDERGLMDSAVFVARAGLDGERIETDMRKLVGLDDKTGYLSVIIVDAERKRK